MILQLASALTYVPFLAQQAFSIFRSLLASTDTKLLIQVFLCLTRAARLVCSMLHQDASGTAKALYCIVLYCIVLYCIVLYCIVLYCIVLYCIVLYCIVLYCYAFPPLRYSTLPYLGHISRDR